MVRSITPGDGLLPRGPLPQTWMDYHGYYVNKSDVILSYQIDGREVLERMEAAGSNTLVHFLEIAAGNKLVVAVGQGVDASQLETIDGVTVLRGNRTDTKSDASDRIGEFTAAKVLGDIDGIAIDLATDSRLQLTIPPDEQDARDAGGCWPRRLVERVETVSSSHRVSGQLKSFNELNGNDSWRSAALEGNA